MVASLEEAHQIIVAQSDTIATLQARIEFVDAALKTALATIEKQQYQLEQYIKRLSGHCSEKYCPDQILFDPILLQSLPDPAAAVAPEPVEEPSESEPRQRKKRSRHGRLPIPDHLERVVIELDIEPDDRICPHTDKPMVLIGCEETEKHRTKAYLAQRRLFWASTKGRCIRQKTIRKIDETTTTKSQ